MGYAKTFIYLFFQEGLDELDRETIKLSIERDFGFPIKVKTLRLDVTPFYDRSRKQFYSTMILKELLLRLPRDAEKALLVVDVDLFIPILTFVFGEAQLGGQVGIVSLTRLRQEFYRLPPNNALLHRRLIKEIKHELGHTFGLVHCSDRACVMSVAHNVLAVDQKGIDFCQPCREFLRRATLR